MSPLWETHLWKSPLWETQIEKKNTLVILKIQRGVSVWDSSFFFHQSLQ